MPSHAPQWYLIEKPETFRYVAPSMFEAPTPGEQMEMAVEHACTEWDKSGQFWLLTCTPVQFRAVRVYSASRESTYRV